MVFDEQLCERMEGDRLACATPFLLMTGARFGGTFTAVVAPVCMAVFESRA